MRFDTGTVKSNGHGNKLPSNGKLFKQFQLRKQLVYFLNCCFTKRVGFEHELFGELSHELSHESGG
jgi:hypothetical protein